MPLLIQLKRPRMELVSEGSIQDDNSSQWDDIFGNQVIITKTYDGKGLVVPTLDSFNIAYIMEVSDEELEEADGKEGTTGG